MVPSARVNSAVSAPMPGMEPRAATVLGGPPSLIPKTNSTKSPGLISGATRGQSFGLLKYVRL
jgi:hypothetical protein